MKRLNKSKFKYYFYLSIEIGLRFFWFCYFSIKSALNRALNYDDTINLFPVSNYIINNTVFEFHQKSILLSYISHNVDVNSVESFKKQSHFESSMPEVPIYILTHTGCYYTAVAQIILSHPKGTEFYLPVIDYLLNTIVIKNIEKLRTLGYSVIVGGISDRRFLLKMFRQPPSTKILIFSDIPPGIFMKNAQKSTKDIIFFNRKGHLFSGVFKLIESKKVESCVVSYNHHPFSRDSIFFSKKHNHLDITGIINSMENSISSSLKDWKYLNNIEFYYQ